MYCGSCPYCHREYKGRSYGEVKQQLKRHLLEEHHAELEEKARGLRGPGRIPPRGPLEWLAGYLAANSIRECRP